MQGGNQAVGAQPALCGQRQGAHKLRHEPWIESLWFCCARHPDLEQPTLGALACNHRLLVPEPEPSQARTCNFFRSRQVKWCKGIVEVCQFFQPELDVPGETLNCERTSGCLVAVPTKTEYVMTG